MDKTAKGHPVFKKELDQFFCEGWALGGLFFCGMLFCFLSVWALYHEVEQSILNTINFP